MFPHHPRFCGLLLAGVALGLASAASGSTDGTGYAVQAQRYVVTLTGDYAVSEGYAVGSSYAVSGHPSYAVYAVTHDYAVYAVQAAGGTVTNDLSRQIGVLIVESSNADFATLLQQYAVMNGYAVIQSVSRDRATKQKRRRRAARRGRDPREAEQWGMTMIRSDRAHAKFLGSRAVDVGILDSGIDAAHVDFTDTGLPGGQSNVDCSTRSRLRARVPGRRARERLQRRLRRARHARGRHRRRAAQRHGRRRRRARRHARPVQVCDGLVCWWSAAIDGITYAGDAKLDVINMSFYADDVEHDLGR